ncbi:hypothetical protein HPB51_005389 [Rhipicephalus microplus]|uniref:Uncharacterized protein n=1 Tax=Rhipicephalus microplus TaxID=6941 RepID=A0A9J6ELP9_RHIMP|nr:hypothetical protein HPB51_005389 [Rhipicephalus microplus]
MNRRFFEIDDRCLLNANVTRTHEDLPPRSKERRPGRSCARISMADYHIEAEDRRCHDVKRLSTAPTSEEATLSKPKQTAAAIQRWRKSGVVRANKDFVEGPKSTDRSRRSVHRPEPDDGIEERRRLLPIATAIPKHGRRSCGSTRIWAVRFGVMFVEPYARTNPSVSVRYSGPPTRYDRGIGCNATAESTAAFYMLSRR